MNKASLTLAVTLAASLTSLAAAAVDGGPNNLKKEKLCFARNNVFASKELQTDSPSLVDDVYKKTVQNLTAYRIPFSTTCGALESEIWVVMDGFKNKANTFFIYTISVKVQSLLYPDLAVIWSQGTYGTTPDTGKTLGTTFADMVGGQLDDLAADYAKANP